MKWKMKKTAYYFILFKKYGKVWNVPLGHFFKHELLIYKEWILIFPYFILLLLLSSSYLFFHQIRSVEFSFFIEFFFQSKLSHIGESRMEMDYKLVENEGLFQEYLEMGKNFFYKFFWIPILFILGIFI